MTRTEATEAVRAYLRHTGGATVDQLYLGLRRQCERAQIRTALRALGASERTFGQWHRQPDALGRMEPRRYHARHGHPPNAIHEFTMYRLGPWHSVGGSTLPTEKETTP